MFHRSAGVERMGSRGGTPKLRMNGGQIPPIPLSNPGNEKGRTYIPLILFFLPPSVYTGTPLRAMAWTPVFKNSPLPSPSPNFHSLVRRRRRRRERASRRAPADASSLDNSPNVNY